MGNGKGMEKEGRATLIASGSCCLLMKNWISVLKMRMNLYLVSASV